MPEEEVPLYDQSDLDMVADTRDSTPAQTELSRLTTLSLTDNKPQAYVEVMSLPPEEKAKYMTGLAERHITSDEEFPEDQMERIIGEYNTNSGVYYFVRMSSGTAFKVRFAPIVLQTMPTQFLCL